MCVSNVTTLLQHNFVFRAHMCATRVQVNIRYTVGISRFILRFNLSCTAMLHLLDISCTHLHCFNYVCSMDLDVLGIELVEIVNKITPNEDELKKFEQFSKEKKNPSSLAENDRFLYEVSYPYTLFAA